MERRADWQSQWRAEPLDPGAAKAEERTQRWRAQERLVKGLLGGFAGLRAIELGAGRGINGLLYARRGADVTLVDDSPLALAQARKMFGAWDVEFDSLEADVFDLPAELSGAYDVAMSFGLCEHFLGDRRRAVVAAHLALVRQRGLVFLGVPNRFAPIYRLWMATLKRRGTWPLGTEEPFGPGELAELARAAGGTPLRPVFGSFFASVVNHGANQILFKLGRRGLAIPQVGTPGLDRLAYELLLPVIKG